MRPRPSRRSRWRPREDPIAEGDETFTATLSAASAGTALSATDASAKGTIADDDAAASDIALTLGPASVAEEAGATTVTVTATLAGDTTLATDTAVAVAVAADTAAATDFAAVAPFTVTIDATDSTGTATFEFAPVDDMADEPAETVTVSGTATGFAVAPAQLAIADDDPPTVVRVAGTDGEYIAGDVAAIEVAFTSAVDVSGAPRLLLETGTTDRHAAYAAGAGTATLRFDYTVQAGDASGDLQYEGTDALALNGGRIQAAADTLDAVLTLPALGAAGSLAASSAVVVDAAKSRTFSIAAARGGEGDPVAFTVTLARAGQPLAASVAYTVATLEGDTATADVDYTPAAATLAFDATATIATFTVATREDPIAEGDETFTATLSAASAGTALSATDASAKGTIADDDAAASDIALTLGPASVAEEAGATTVTVTATLAGDTTLATDTAVAVAVAADTAAATDFAAVAPFTVTIDATDSTGTATFEFAPVDDMADEPAETVTVSGTATGFAVAPAQLAIADDDPPTVVRVAGTDGEYIAGDVAAIEVAFTSAVDVSGAPRLLLETGTTDRHAAYAAGAGTATLRFDYTVQAGDASGDLQYEGTDALALNGGRIQAAADTLDAVLTLPALGAAGSLAASSAVVVDAAKSRTFSIAAARGGEGDPVAFTVTLARAGQPLAASVAYTVATLEGDTATADVDYTPAAATLAFDATATIATFTVATREDPIAEGDETFTATLSAASAGTALSATDASAKGTIADDDAAASDIALTLGPASVAEEAGATTVTVTATLAGDTTLATDTAVAVAVAADTAAATDFAAVAPFTVTIDATDSTGTATFEFAPVDDMADEPAETVTVSGTATGFAVAPAQLAIADDDPPTVVRVAGTDGEYIAGDVAAIEVAFTSAVDVSGAPRLLLETGTTDRHAAYAAGAGTATLRFDYTVQAGDASGDLQYEGTDALALNGGRIQAAADTLDAVLTLPALGAAGSLAASSAVVVDAAKSRTFSIAAARGGEGDPVAFTVTLARAGQPRAASVAYTVATLAGDTATADADYTPAAATLAFDATATIATFTVATREDPIAEGDETFTATLSAASAGTALSATDASAKGTIADDDAAASDIALTLGPASVAEEAGATTVTVTATLAGDTTLATDTAVAVAVAADTAAATDFAAVAPFTVTIDATDSTGTATFEFAPVDDMADEPAETVTVSGTATGFAVAPAQLAIADDDPPTVVRVAGTDGEYIAGDVAAIEVAFTSAVDVSGAPRLLLETGTTDRHAAYAAGAGTATLRFDYTVQAGDASGDLQYEGTDALALNGGRIQAAADTLDAVLTLPALGAAGSLAASSAVVVDAAKSRTFSIAAARGGEGDPVAFTVTLARAGQPRAASVAYTVATLAGDTATADADYTPAAATLAFDATATIATFTVATREDPIAEGDETFTATLSAASAGTALSATDASAKGTIADDDAAASDIALTLGPASVAEEAGATTVTVTATLAGDTTLATDTAVAVAVAADTAAATDFAAVAPFTVTIDATDSTGTATFEFAPVDDMADEPAETVTVSGTATGFAVAPAQLAIADDDPPTVVRVAGTDGEYIAGDVAAIEVAFTSAVDVSGAPRLLLETGTTDRHAAYAAGAGTATLRFDYTVQAGDASGDLQYEGTDALALNGGRIQAAADSLDAALTLPALDAAGSLAASSAVVVDAAKSRTFSIAAARGGEGDPVAFTVTLARAGQPLAASVAYTVATLEGDTATADADYTPAAATLAFDATATIATFTVATREDPIAEGDETFTATLSAASAGTALSATDASAKGTIADDDAAASDIALTLGPASVAEEAGATTVTVTATLAGDTTLATDTAVAVAVAADTAAATDFAAVAPFTVTIDATDSTGTATFEFAPVDDMADEPAETVTVSGTATGFAVAPAQLAIADDDPPTVVRVAGTDGEYIAGDVAAIEVAFTSAVDVSGAPRLLLETGTTDRHAAYAAGAGTATLRFDYTVQAGDASGDLQYEGTDALALNGGRIQAAADSLDAALTLPALDAAGSLAGSGAVVVDTAKSRTFSIAAARGGEGDPVAFTVTLARAGQPLAASVAYTVATLEGDTATADADYTPAAATLAFDATATIATFTVATREDPIAEGDETFTATLSAASAGTALSATDASAKGTIADDDAAASDIALTLGPASVAEEAGATTVTVTATLAGDTTLATDTAVAVAVAADTAAATDFAAVAPFTVTIDATDSTGTATFEFAPVDDMADEPAETVTVSGTATGFHGRAGAARHRRRRPADGGPGGRHGRRVHRRRRGADRG